MNILITGAKGFVGKNLTEALKNIKNNKDRTHPDLKIDEIFCFDVDSTNEELCEFCSKADFVFNLAGVNRPENSDDFKKGNCDFAERLLNTLKNCGNKCPVMLSSSVQASLSGRFENSIYGISKKLGEDLFFDYANETGAEVFVFRFPNLFGKWCRPNYNSVVATFCNNIANDLPIAVNDKNVELELLYIDDLVDALISLLEGKASRCEFNGAETVNDDNGKYCTVCKSHKVTLGKIAELLYQFKKQSKELTVPEIPQGSFEKKLYSTYLSYLPRNEALIEHKMNVDERGSFTELIKTAKCGQVSVNISKPGVTKGQHWHNTKCEYFTVVSGHGLIQQRKIGTDEILNFEVSGDKIETVITLPGYTHNIINLSDTEDLVTVMWANECFNPEKPDTFFEKVK